MSDDPGGFRPLPPPPPPPPPAAEPEDSPNWPRRAWTKFRSWPLWVQILIGLVVLAVIVGPFTSQNEPESDTTSAEGTTTTAELRTTTTEERTTTTERETTTTTEPPTTTTTTTTEPPTTTTTAAPTTTTTAEDPELANARESARSYLDFAGFSRQGLIDQLSSEYGDQYPVEIATAAVDSLNVDYNAEAVEAAESYLEFSPFSHAGLVDQLSSEYGDQFTPEQAEHGATVALG